MTDQTYYERALKAEARVLELEDELKAWRAYVEPDTSAPRAAWERVAAAQRVLRTVAPGRSGPAVARLLLFLADHPEEFHTRELLSEVVSDSEADLSIRRVDVTMSTIRQALGKLGFPNVIRNAFGEGWCIERAEAVKIRALLGVAP